jgi:hypothetical protein
MIARHPNQLGESRFELLESQFEVGFGFTDVTGKDEPVPRMTRNLQQCPSVGLITQMKIAYRVQFHSGYLSLWRWNARYCSLLNKNAGHANHRLTDIVLPNAGEQTGRFSAAQTASASPGQ